MDTFEIYTIGNAYFVEKMFQAINLIFSSGLTGVLKIAVSISLGLLAIKASITSNFKEVAKWAIAVVILMGLFLNTKANVIIHDSLPDSHRRMQASYPIKDVPWGLALIAHATSNVGNVIMKKFDSSFSGVTNNQNYRKYGILFGSKIIEDASRIRITNPDLRSNMVRFYKECMVPDLRMGHERKNGYTLKELAQAENIGDFLNDHASRARKIYMSGSVTKKSKHDNIIKSIFGKSKSIQSDVNGYISCNKAAHFINDVIEQELEDNSHIYASSFVSQFMNDKSSAEFKNKFFDSVLSDTYGAFLKSSKNASEILKQNIMINAVKDSARSVASQYAQITSEEMTRSSMHSVSQMFQKFIPIIRSIFECLFYAVFPLILILMVTPIGLEVLKNYAFSFVYLQMWPPMYAILYVITESWSRMSSSDLKHNMESLPQIEAINYDISMVSGYMLALIPVLSMFVTKGLMASVGNMATSMLYIPQTAAVNTSDQAVKGNFSIGSTNIDNHSYDNLNAHKHDDNYRWMSGMKGFQTHTGSMHNITPTGKHRVDLSGASNNSAGFVNISWSNIIGNSFNESEDKAQREVEIATKDYTQSLGAAFNKTLGYDSNYSEGTSGYTAINKSMSHEERQAAEYARGITDKISEIHGMSSSDVIKMSAAAKGGLEVLGNGVTFETSGATESQKQETWNAVQEAMKDRKFSESLNTLEAFGKSDNIQKNDSASDTTLDSVKSDFNQASSASSRKSTSQENLRSIQQSKSNYKKNSQNIDQNLTSSFMDWGIEKYGAERFENMLRNEPIIARDIAKTFIEEKIGEIEKYKFAPIKPQNLNLNESDKQRVLTTNKENNHDVNEYSGGKLLKATSKKNELHSKFTEQSKKFEDHSEKQKQILAGKKSAVENQADKRELEGKQKTEQLASQQFGGRIVDTGKEIYSEAMKTIPGKSFPVKSQKKKGE